MYAKSWLDDIWRHDFATIELAQLAKETETIVYVFVLLSALEDIYISFTVSTLWIQFFCRHHHYHDLCISKS